MLNIRQRLAYRHLVDVWSTTRSIAGGTGKPSSETYTLVKSNLPVMWEFTPNINSETGAGRLKEFTLLVLDKLYAEANAPITDMSIIVNVSLLADGSKANNWGEVSRVEGAPTITDAIGNRRANHLYVETMSIDRPPEPFKSHYGL